MKEKIDITKTITLVNVFFITFEIPDKSKLSFTEPTSEKHMQTFLDEGCTEKEARRKAEKKAIEDARYVLPNACATKMVMTANARSLHNFFRLRCCNRAQWEIRELAEEMYKQVCAVAPTLFRKAGPACTCGACSEGKMTCGKAAEVRAKYEKIRQECAK